VLLHLRYRGPNVIPCEVSLRRGEEMGWFEHGSTIIVFAPRGASLSEGIEDGGRIRMGQPLMRIDRLDLPQAHSGSSSTSRSELSDG